MTNQLLFKHKTYLKSIVIELDIFQNTLKSTVIENILNCGVLKFLGDFMMFGWNFLVKK